MAYKPTQAGPRNPREMFHWAYKQFQLISAELPVVPLRTTIDSLEQKIAQLEQRITDLENAP